MSRARAASASRPDVAEHSATLLIGHSERVRHVHELIGRIAPSSASVLITGESGTGKEMAAREIHRLSRRREARFVPVNCGAITPTLAESELFGHERGSFTGADRRHRGYFERASGGTLFLDEITEMPPETQAKLLRVIETDVVTRVGGEKSVPVDVRILAASNRGVPDALAEGRLRADLYYRLKVFEVTLPSLRDRPVDVPEFVRYFLRQLDGDSGGDRRFTQRALHALSAYAWPGNVRELRNVVESAAILACEDVIDVEHLPREIADDGWERPSVKGDRLEVAIGTPLHEVERWVIQRTLERYSGNRTKTAETLGIGLETLCNRLNEYGQ